MKRKAGTRLFSALLALVMLVSLMPAAFAASNSIEIDASMDSDDYLSLDFLDKNIPYYDYYITDISGDSENDRYEPDIVDNWDDRNWSYIEEDELDDYYFSSYGNSYGEYEYTIVVISEDDRTHGDKFYIYLTLYVDDDGYGHSTDGDLYAETDRTGVLDLDDIAQEIYDYANAQLGSRDYPNSVRFTSSDGYFYDENGKTVSGWVGFLYDGEELEQYVYFSPDDEDGESEISFTVASNNDKRVSGTIIVNDGGSSSASEIKYSTAYRTEVFFNSSDFEDVCEDVTGRDLDYVKFSLPSSSKGTLYAEYDGTSGGSVAAKSSDKFYADASSREYDLDDVAFVPRTGDTVELSYTAYTTRGTSFTGKVTITTSAGELRDITYTTGGKSSVAFSASDFTAALREQTSKTLSSVTFILPRSSEGVLYYNGNTKVSAGTQYKASGSANSLDKVSFKPASTVSGGVRISYTARDSGGNSYSGAVVVQTFVGQDTVIVYSTNGQAVSFRTSDFTSACAKKLNTTLSYVQFALPKSSEGTLYYGWDTSQQARVSANVKYTAAVYLPYVSFVPKAGFSGSVTIAYTGYDTAGSYYIGAVQVVVTPPAKSTYFTDVSGNAGWAAPAADFLKANNVYDGVVSGSALGVGTQVTRGEVMQMVYNAFNLENKMPKSNVTSHFTDVPATHPYYTAINTGYQLNVVLGDGTGKFRPNDPITRQDACTMLYRAFNQLGLSMSTGTVNDLKGFGDYATVSDYAVNAVAGMVKSGIVQGNEKNNISPKSNFNRGEISVTLHRAMTL